MAEEEDEINEKEELERLLGENEDQESQEDGLVQRLKNQLKAILKSKKFLIFFGVVIVFLITAVVIWKFFILDPDADKQPVEKQSQDEPEEVKLTEPQDLVNNIRKVNSYHLEPFFFPLDFDKPGLGHITIGLIFILSNQKVGSEVEKNIGNIRQEIYKLLKKRKPKDYIGNQSKLKEKLKKEIMKVSNSLLSSGVGVVDDILFTEFMVR